MEILAKNNNLVKYKKFEVNFSKGKARHSLAKNDKIRLRKKEKQTGIFSFMFSIYKKRVIFIQSSLWI